MKITLYLFLCLLLPVQLCAAAFTVRGWVTHADGSSAAYSPASLEGDGRLYKTRCNDSGQFTLPGIAPGHYALAIKSLLGGYADSIWVDRDLDLGNIALGADTIHLNEFVISQQARAVQQNSDTTEFNANGYGLDSNNDAADLVRRLPTGFVNGQTVTLLGQPVTKIYVDGLPFFDYDVYGALKNLPYDMLQKIQVFDEPLSPSAATLGGPTQVRAINIITRPNKRNRIFGDAGAGGGFREPATPTGNGVLMLNNFQGANRASFRGNANTTNRSDVQETKASAGGGTTSPGVTANENLGININRPTGPAADLYFSYTLTGSQSQAQTNVVRNYFTLSDTPMQYLGGMYSVRHSVNHTAALRYHQAYSKKNDLTTQLSLNRNSSDNTSTNQAQTINGGTITNAARYGQSMPGTNLSIAGNMAYKRLFSNTRRTLAADVTIQRSLNEQYVQTAFYNERPGSADSAANKTSGQMTAWGLTANARGTLPAGKKGTLKMGYDFHVSFDNTDRAANAYSFTDRTFSLPDSLLSSQATSRSLTQALSLSAAWAYRQFAGETGLRLQATSLSGTWVLPAPGDVNFETVRLLPFFNLSYSLPRARKLTLNGNTLLQPPALQQLAPGINNRDPLRLFSGNPALRPALARQLSFSTIGFVAGRWATSVFATGGYTAHPIVSHTLFAERDTVAWGGVKMGKGAQWILPVNGRPSAYADVTLAAGIAFPKQEASLNTSLSAGIRQQPGVLNGTNYTTLTRNLGTDINFFAKPWPWLETELLATGTAARTTQGQTATGNLFVSWAVSAAAAVHAGRFTVSSAVARKGFSGSATGPLPTQLIWNLAISGQVKKGSRLTLTMKAYDVLRANSYVNQINTPTYYETEKGAAPTSVFNLIAHYKIVKDGNFH